MQWIHSSCICFYFKFVLITCFPGISITISTRSYFFHYLCIESLPFLHGLQTISVLYDRRQAEIHRSAATSVSRGANSPFLSFPWGLTDDARGALRRPHLHVDISFIVSSLIKATQTTRPISFHFFHPGSGKQILMPWEKCYIKFPAIFWRFKI